MASYHRPAAWFVEHIQGFGFRLTPEPPWAARGTLEDYSDNEELLPEDDGRWVVYDPFDD